MATDAITMNVNAQELFMTADSFESNGRNVANLTCGMLNLVNGLSGIWEGEAAQAFISKFNGLEDDIQRMVNMISEHVSDLREMGQNYTEAENLSTDATESLLVDVIE